ncbi:hypothetical protein PPTG_01670 [Phytophthora nicotianae INRA-310]|uniref:Carboxypeptidase n=1 Tax=Phytophthora nicotianae (strain INRA-310) TaxID=761204 RepID=W2RAE0_PHYN3|nr:hypothetical protein PPTG_01670 [Phytophthora nicotianae INRA-310]ETN21515.1 hypothetical protein PPTG_01670 [Phytophthora nicotianae INRA-310]
MCFVVFIISIVLSAGTFMRQAGGMAHTDVCKLEKQDAGYIDLPNRVDSHYFYWYFESRNKPNTDPLLVWLPGGPGMGGTYGMLAENGPFTINTDLSTKINPFSWTAQANMVWVDIPVNSGFSYSPVAEDDELTDERVAESVFWFLQGFMKKHQELQGRELFFVGESYGGHFVPSVAHYIWKKQGEHLFSPASPDTIPINLRGIAIGNALTDPVEIFGHFVDMADNPYSITLLNETQLAAMQVASPVCRSLVTECQTNTSRCAEAGSFCISTQWIPMFGELWDPYDIRQKCDTAVSNMSACMPKVPTTKGYLDLPDVRGFLGVHPSRPEWIQLNATINSGFFGPPAYSGLLSVGDKVAELLNAGLRVLMYVGDADLLCNFYAIEATAKKLNWFGAGGFNAAKARSYSTASGIKDAGTIRSFSHLTYVKIHNAGHMAPGDQPEVALDMISKFIGSKKF